jgi:hypothetical protein
MQIYCTSNPCYDVLFIHIFGPFSSRPGRPADAAKTFGRRIIVAAQ